MLGPVSVAMLVPPAVTATMRTSLTTSNRPPSETVRRLLPEDVPRSKKRVTLNKELFPVTTIVFE